MAYILSGRFLDWNSTRRMQTCTWKSLLAAASVSVFPSSSIIHLGVFYHVVLSITECLEVSTTVVTLYVILSGK